MENSTNLIVISPHLDDGVFSCGEAMAFCPRSTVITVFAGAPEPPVELTSWDALCGFKPGDDVISIRREEDRKALLALDAMPIWLDFLDSQYGPSPPLEEVARALTSSISTVWEQKGRNQICFPLGLFHSDHLVVRNAALMSMKAFPDVDWLIYEDVPYRSINGLRDEALTTVRSQGVYTMRYRFPVNAWMRKLKKEAVLCYESQLNGLLAVNRPGYLSLFAEEHYFFLTPGTPTRSLASASLRKNL